MKAEIDREGFIVIKAESGIETYALRQWGKENVKHDTQVNLMIHTEVEVPGETGYQAIKR